MPRGDRTGPAGMGRMSGRGAGFCAGYTAPGYMNSPGLARGFGCGFGRGRGFFGAYRAAGMQRRARYGYRYPAYDATGGESADEKVFLNNQVEFLEEQLEQVKKRLSSLEGNNE